MNMTKKQKLEHFDRVQRERDRLELALHDIVNESVVWGAWVREPGGPGKYRVGIADRAYPIAIQIWRVKDQRDSVHVYDANRGRTNSAIDPSMRGGCHLY